MKRILFAIAMVISVSADSPAQILRWTFATGGKIYSSPSIANGTVYFGSADGHLYAVDAASGIERWRFETGGAVHSSPFVADGIVYVGSHDGNLYAVSANEGTVVWSFETGGEKRYGLWDYYLSSPTVSDDLVLFGSGDGNVYAVDKRSGKQLWSFSTGDIVHASPVVVDGIVYVGSFDGFFYALDIEDGSLVWKFDTVGDKYFPRGEIQKAALVQDGTVFFGSRDYNIYALDAATGTGRWNMKERGSWIVATPLLFRDKLYFGTSDSHTFYAMEADYGDIVWKLPLNMRAYGSAIEVNETIYFGCFNGKLYAVDPENGEILWTYQTQGSLNNYRNVYDENDEFSEGFLAITQDWAKMEDVILSLGSILSTPAEMNGTIYFGSSDGQLYAVGLD